MDELNTAILTEHAKAQMSRRGIDPQQVHQVLTQPEDVMPVREGRLVVQRIIGQYLFRVFVDVDRRPPEVVTVYRTSKIDKYRSQP